MSDLIEQARENARSEQPGEWGYLVTLEIGAAFEGRWRGTDVDSTYDRPVYLLWDRDGQPCYMRHYAALGRRVDAASLSTGDRVAIVREDDYESANGTGYSFGLAYAPSDEPLPAGDDPTADW